MKNTFLCAESNTTTWIFVALLVVLVVVLLVVPMFTNKKRAKQTTELHNSLRPGDVIKTVGGIIGTIKSIRQISPNDKEMVIETGEGDNKTTMVFDIQALYQVMSRADAPVDAFEEHTDEPKTEEEAAPAAPVETVVAEEPEAKPQEPDVKPEESIAEEKPEEKINAAAETASTVEQPEPEDKPQTAPKAPAARKTTSAPKSTGAKKKPASSSTQKSTKK